MTLEKIIIQINGRDKYRIPFNEEFEDGDYRSLSRRAYQIADEYLRELGMEDVKYTIPYVSPRSFC